MCARLTEPAQVEDAVAMAEGVAQTSREEWLQARPVLEKLALGRRFSTLQAWRWASATVRECRTFYFLPSVS